MKQLTTSIARYTPTPASFAKVIFTDAPFPPSHCLGCNRVGCKACINRYDYCKLCWASMTPEQQKAAIRAHKVMVGKMVKFFLSFMIPAVVILVVAAILGGALYYPEYVWGPILGVGFFILIVAIAGPPLRMGIRLMRKERKEQEEYRLKNNLPKPQRLPTPKVIKIVISLVILIFIVVIVVGIILAQQFLAD